MDSQALHELITKLQEAQKQISDLLASVVANQDWRPAHDEWSFRDIGAHLATSEKECLLPRLKQIATGERPHFDYYDNSDYDFSHIDLKDSLAAWHDTRQEIIALIRNLPEQALLYTAKHDSFGTITSVDYLEIWSEHDHDHLRDLIRNLEKFNFTI